MSEEPSLHSCLNFSYTSTVCCTLASSAASKIAKPSSSCSSVITIGIKIRRTFPNTPALSSNNPRLFASFTIRCVSSLSASFVSGSFTSSIADIAPNPRISPIQSYFSASFSNRDVTTFPRYSPRSFSFSSSMISSTAKAASHPRGLPQYVPPSSPGLDSSMISARPMTPLIGTQLLVILIP